MGVLDKAMLTVAKEVAQRTGKGLTKSLTGMDRATRSGHIGGGWIHKIDGKLVSEAQYESFKRAVSRGDEPPRFKQDTLTSPSTEDLKKLGEGEKITSEPSNYFKAKAERAADEEMRKKAGRRYAPNAAARRYGIDE